MSNNMTSCDGFFVAINKKDIYIYTILSSVFYLDIEHMFDYTSYSKKSLCKYEKF